MTGFSTTPSLGVGFTLILAAVDKLSLATGEKGTWLLLEKRAAGPSFSAEG